LRIYFNIGNQPDNLGDLILNRNAVSIYAKNGEVIFDDHHVDEHYIREMGGDPNNAISRRPDLPNLRTTKGRLKMLLSPKQYYQVFARPPGHMFRRKSLRGYWHSISFTLFLLALRLRGTRVMLMGVTISTDQLSGPLLWLERLQARLHHLHSVRDSSVHRRLIELGVSQNKLVPDLFLLATPDAPPVSQRHVEVRDHLRIVLSLRSEIPEAKDKAKYREMVKRRVLELVQSLPNDAEVILSFQVEVDEGFMAEIFKELSGDSRVSLREACETVESARELYSSATAVISNRLHCLLYAVTLGTPAIPFSDQKDHQKLRGAFEDFGLIDWFYDIHQEPGLVVARLHEIVNDEWATRSEIFEVASELKRKVELAIEEAMR